MATGAAEFIDATTADARIPEAWSKKSIVAREQELVFAGLVNRSYEGDVLGDRVHVPSRGHLTTQTKTLDGNAATVYETVTETNTDLIINTWEYNAIAVETATKKLSHVDLLKLYAPEQGYTLARSVDDVLAGYPDGSAAGQTVGTLAVALAYEDVLAARQALDDADVPVGDRVIVVSPAQEAGFLKLDQFIHRDYDSIHGSPSKPALNKAFIGSWMNMPVYKSTNVEGTNAAGHDNTMFHREAIALAMALEMNHHNMFDIDYFAFKVSVEQLYGSAVFRADHLIWLKGL